MPTFEMFNQWFITNAPKLLGAITIVVVGFSLARYVDRLLRRGLEKTRLDRTLHSFLVTLARISIQVVALISAAGALGIPTTGMITVLGGAALAISLALQNSLANVASGLLLLITRPFRVGDYIEVSDKAGTVESIRLMTTVLIELTGMRIIMPNAQMTNQRVINYSTETYRTLRRSFEITYESDLLLAKKLLLDIAASHPLCLDEPPPAVMVSALANTGVTLMAVMRCERPNYMPFLYDLNEKVKLAFDANGIAFAYPQVVVHNADKSMD
jgi:small conductance mechanosensitive channel